MDSEQSISIPSLVILGVISVLAVRYFFFAPASQANANGSSGGSRQADPNDIDQVATVFPQLSRRDITWDLQRNGGSVASTTERILSTGSLEPAPQTFQPIFPSQPARSTATTSSSGQSKTDHIDLIQRYKLADKVNDPSSQSKGDQTLPSPQAWSQDKDERQTLLRRRREEMILNARRKLEKQEADGMVP